MDFNTLQKLVGVTNNKFAKKTLSLHRDNFPDSLAAFFIHGYQNHPINLSNVRLVECDAQQQRIHFTGKGDYLNVPGAEASLQCLIDEHGQVQLIISYQLLGANPGPGDWTFSKSFPNLPQTADESGYLLFNRQTGETWQKQRVLLDDFFFFNASFVVSSNALADPLTERQLQPGINFIGQVRPEGAAAIVAKAFQVTAGLPVSGTIRRPLEGETTSAVRAKYHNQGTHLRFPWSITDPVPGIVLTIDTDMASSFGNNAVRITGNGLKVYTPIDNEWTFNDTNPPFQPMQAMTGEVSLPEANICTAITMPWEPGIAQWYGMAHCEGITLANLASMAGISGDKNGLLSHLPQALQKSAKALGRLELTGFNLLVDYREEITVKELTMTIAMPEFTWEIWPDRFQLRDIGCIFKIRQPFSTGQRQITSKLTAAMDVGDVHCHVSASSTDHFAFYASMDRGQSIPLGQLLQKYAPKIPLPAELTVSSLKLGVEPGKAYSMAMAMDEQHGTFTIPLGPTTLAVEDLSMYVNYQHGQGFSGSFSGKTMLNDNVLRLNYDTPGDVLIYSYLPKTSLRAILKTLTAGELTLPTSFDLDLEHNTLQLQKNDKDYTFWLATEVHDTGTLVLQIGRQTGQWGAAFGLALNKPELSRLPGLQALKFIDDQLTLSEVTLLVSSFDSPTFSFPQLASFNNPSLQASSIPMPAAGSVVKGFNGHAKLTLDTGDKTVKLLRQVLGLDPSLQVTLQVASAPGEATRLYTSIETKLAGKYPLSARFGFIAEKGSVSLYLTGQLTVKIARQPVNFAMAMSVLPGGVFFAGSAAGTVRFGNLKLSNMGLALGINWGGVPSVGIAAQIDTRRFSSSIALVVDSTNPAKSVLAGSISQLSLADITREFAKVSKLPSAVQKSFKSIKLRSTRTFTIAASTVSALDNKDYGAVSAAFGAEDVVIPDTSEMLLIVVRKKGRIWSLTDMSQGMRHYTVTLKDKTLEVAITPQLYLAPSGARMGELTFTQGYFLSGCLQILGQRWATQVEISNGKGIAATSYMTQPLQFVNKDFFRFSDYDNKRGPMISLSSFCQPRHEIPALRNPHIALSGRLRLLGQESAAFANITTRGVDIMVESDSSTILKENFIRGSYDLDWKIQGSVGTLSDIFLSGAINFQLKGKFELARLLKVRADLGKLKVNTLANSEIELGYQNQKAFIDLDGRFQFAGEHFAFHLEADASNTQINHLGNSVLNEIKQVVTHIYDSAEKWLQGVDDGMVELAKSAGSVGKALKSGYRHSAQEATKLLHKSGRSAEQIGNELKSGFGSSAKQAVKLLKDVGATSDDIGRMASKTYRQSARQTARLMKDVGMGADQITKALGKVFQSSGKDIARTLRDIGHSPQTIAHCLDKITRAKPQDIARQMKEAGLRPGDIGNALKGIGHSDEMVAKLLKGAGFKVKDVAKVLRQSWKFSGENGAKLLRKIGYGSSDIAQMLKAKDVWNQGSKDISKALKKAGFSDKTVKSAMKSAGVALKTIEKAFSWL